MSSWNDRYWGGDKITNDDDVALSGPRRPQGVMSESFSPCEPVAVLLSLWHDGGVEEWCRCTECLHLTDGRAHHTPVQPAVHTGHSGPGRGETTLAKQGQPANITRPDLPTNREGRAERLSITPARIEESNTITSSITIDYTIRLVVTAHWSTKYVPL